MSSSNNNPGIFTSFNKTLGSTAIKNNTKQYSVNDIF
jgi:hypothetical protein